MGHGVTLALSLGVTVLPEWLSQRLLVAKQTYETREPLVKLTRDVKQTKFRIPEEMLTYLKEQAEKNFRSVNAELLARLVRTMEQDNAGVNNA